jgi:hypothetical protein
VEQHIVRPQLDILHHHILTPFELGVFWQQRWVDF